jgi:hypothetical protein
MNRKFQRPPGALQTADAGWIVESATHLVERGLGILSAKAGVSRVGRSQPGDKKTR